MKFICAACGEEIPSENCDLSEGLVRCLACETEYDVSLVRSPEGVDPQAFEELVRKHRSPHSENQLTFRERCRLSHYAWLLWLALIAFFWSGGGIVLMWKGAFRGSVDSFANLFKTLFAGAGGFLLLWLGLWAMIAFFSSLFRTFGRTHLSLENGRFSCTSFVGPFPFRRCELPVNSDSKVGISLRYDEDEDEDNDLDMTECHLFLETDGEELDGRKLWLPEEDLGFLVTWIEKKLATRSG